MVTEPIRALKASSDHQWCLRHPYLSSPMAIQQFLNQFRAHTQFQLRVSQLISLRSVFISIATIFSTGGLKFSPLFVLMDSKASCLVLLLIALEFHQKSEAKPQVINGLMLCLSFYSLNWPKRQKMSFIGVNRPQKGQNNRVRTTTEDTRELNAHPRAIDIPNAHYTWPVVSRPSHDTHTKRKHEATLLNFSSSCPDLPWKIHIAPRQELVVPRPIKQKPLSTCLTHAQVAIQGHFQPLDEKWRV